ncbi:hypothetical protein L7F22_010265 [Adiantum nelumboides]|nr:hypothetical protein [Adiantum nelumboides]
MARCWRRQTQGLTAVEQQEILEQLMHHQPFSRLRSLEVQSSLISGVRNTLTQLKVPHSSSELFVKRTSLTMILNNADQRTTPLNQCKIATVLGVHQRNIAAASCRLEMEDEDEVLPLSACPRQMPLHTSITSETRDLVIAFWKSETRIFPNKKDICKHKIEAKCVIRHPIHLLDDSQVLDSRGYLLTALGHGLWPSMVLLSEVVQTFILADFCYYYVKSVVEGQSVMRLPSGVV